MADDRDPGEIVRPEDEAALVAPEAGETDEGETDEDETAEAPDKEA